MRERNSLPLQPDQRLFNAHAESKRRRVQRGLAMEWIPPGGDLAPQQFRGPSKSPTVGRGKKVRTDNSDIVHAGGAHRVLLARRSVQFACECMGLRSRAEMTSTQRREKRCPGPRPQHHACPRQQYGYFHFPVHPIASSLFTTIPSEFTKKKPSRANVVKINNAAIHSFWLVLNLDSNDRRI